jgi:murein DD-endopeptidase MepM/ murein hydrolase activator NlpD
LLILLGWVNAACAVPFTVSFGEWVQGGVVALQLDPSVKQFRVDQQEALLNHQQQTLVGIGRDATQIHLQWQDHHGQWYSYIQPIISRTYDVQRINGLPNNKVNPNPEEVAEIQRNNAAIAAVRKLKVADRTPILPFAWPTQGRISGVYGSVRILNGQPRRPHFGVDIAAPEGTPIYAPADGVVILKHDSMVLTGQTLMLEHGLGLKSIYVHLAQMLVNEGDEVQRGTLIGRVGKTGRATGPHLHWGVSWFDVQVDPVKLVSTEQP